MSLHEYLQADPGCGRLLEGAVLAVAPMLEDPDPAPPLALVRGWVDELVGRMPLPWNFHAAVDEINHFLFREQGFRGDREHYDDPGNAALPTVLRRRRGLPISLSILWMEVARGLGFDPVGIALPGHFIAGLRGDLGILYFDPFNGGRALDLEGAELLVGLATQGRVAFDPAMLQPVSHRAILVRVVRNLHVRFLRSRAWAEALWTSTHLMLLSPGESLPFRDRALVHFHRGEIPAALDDLREALRRGQELDGELMGWVERYRA